MIRPTSDRVRKALFDILGRRIEGADFLDVYAGTGAVGCEALSRGARRVVFLERDSQALNLIEHNLKIEAWTGLGEIVPGDVRTSLRDLESRGRRFDIVFLDPPYDQPIEPDELQRVVGLIEARGALVVEHRATERMAAPVLESHSLRTYRHGDSALSIWRTPEALRRA